ncbi:hypothetical protein N7532_002310 [Penicillium argentinense]|uniref:Uncharacterized protein n=1 Tax=Penicillium argentinense TaxID=1131581 RepID=A0A9W9KKH7_9EURO|nr:uncharacterized protein N7532_002310 [Penicillium argentinense]KAJ5109665.1 hypothetical protein N7532_002310 [Penicillium argentinense]
MAGSSHNICPNSLALQSDDNAWESGYADVPWSNPSHYSTSSGIAVAHHWDPRDTQVITNMPPAAKSPSSNSMITPPMTQYHTSCLPWSIASPCNYILPDAQNTTRVSNPALGTPMTNTSSLHSSPEESPDSTTCEHTCEHGLTPHPKRQALGVEYV